MLEPKGQVSLLMLWQVTHLAHRRACGIDRFYVILYHPLSLIAFLVLYKHGLMKENLRVGNPSLCYKLILTLHLYIINCIFSLLKTKFIIMNCL